MVSSSFAVFALNVLYVVWGLSIFIVITWVGQTDRQKDGWTRPYKGMRNLIHQKTFPGKLRADRLKVSISTSKESKTPLTASSATKCSQRLTTRRNICSGAATCSSSWTALIITKAKRPRTKRRGELRKRRPIATKKSTTRHRYPRRQPTKIHPPSGTTSTRTPPTPLPKITGTRRTVRHSRRILWAITLRPRPLKIRLSSAQFP